MKILISGHNGFVGKHLLRRLKCQETNYDIEFLTRLDFESVDNLVSKISPNDIIFHFAGVNRDISEEEVLKKNNEINDTLCLALDQIQFNGKLLFTSSIQEESGTLYGNAKKNARLKFIEQSKKLNYLFYGLITPNIFGPFCKPNYNSFIATFSSMIVEGKTPTVEDDKKVSLIYIGDFIDEIIKILDKNNSVEITDRIINDYSVSDILKQLNSFNDIYIKKGKIPNLDSDFSLRLFNSFVSYIDLKNFYPKKYNFFEDDRGLFAELMRTFSKGQTSYSITKKGEIRGNHFHTRKVERFSVIKGKAKIQLREVLSEEKIEFLLDGSSPSYVDMPIWYTHNIENIGNEDLITIFWINEHYEEEASDTYLENV